MKLILNLCCVFSSARLDGGTRLPSLYCKLGCDEGIGNHPRCISAVLRWFNARRHVSERRPLVVTIDGDGFIYNHRESGHAVGELIRDRILRAYPCEFTASFIAHELEEYRSRFDIALAREILALANVEAASHSWSHPHDWIAPGVDAGREIVDSVRYLEAQLLTPGKRVQMFLWSGLCNPTEDHLRLAESLGIGNLNGGDPLLPYTFVGGRRHYHSRAWNDWVGMDLQRRVAKLAAAWKRIYSPRRSGSTDSAG